MTDEQEERVDKMREQLSSIKNAVEELMHIVSECLTCKRRYNEWLQQTHGKLETNTTNLGL